MHPSQWYCQNAIVLNGNLTELLVCERHFLHLSTLYLLWNIILAEGRVLASSRTKIFVPLLKCNLSYYSLSLSLSPLPLFYLYLLLS
jgi:hypothetical protein